MSLMKIIIGFVLAAQIALATEMPTSMPTAAITDIPVGNPVVVFAVSLGYDGVNLATWNTNVASNNAAACAATTYTLGLPKSSCTVTNVQDTSSRRLFGGRSLTTPSVDVTTTLSAPGTTASVSGYTSTLNTAVSTGAFQQSVRTAASANSASDLVTVVVPTSQTATAVGAPADSIATAAPTWAPTSGPKSSSNSNNAAESPGAIVGYVLGGLVVIAALVYCFAPTMYGLPEHSAGGAGGDDDVSSPMNKDAKRDTASNYQNVL